MAELNIAADTNNILEHSSELKRFLRIFFARKVVIFGFVVILATIFIAIFAPIIAPYDQFDQDLTQTLQQPSKDHLLGTDRIGRDTFSRIIYGSRISLMVGTIAIFIAATAGIIIGMAAGYFGGAVYTILMRLVDSLMCFPMLFLPLVIAALLGGGLKNVLIALGIGLTPVYARLMCAQVLTIKEMDYIMAANTMGAKPMHIIMRHVLPNAFPPLIVLITMMIGAAILAEASLSFLGIGIEPPTASWGSMVHDGYYNLLTNPILSIAPGFAIMLVVFSFNMIGDGLRDALDPRLRGII